MKTGLFYLLSVISFVIAGSMYQGEQYTAAIFGVIHSIFFLGVAVGATVANRVWGKMNEATEVIKELKK